jgi:monofunctional biosynthetic peptidoglycan transglycosylase
MHPDEESTPSPGEEPQPERSQTPDPAGAPPPPAQDLQQEPHVEPAAAIEAASPDAGGEPIPEPVLGRISNRRLDPEPAPLPPAPEEEHDDEPSYDAAAEEGVYDEAPAQNLFGAPAREAYIPLPGEGRGDPRRARDAQINLDLDLARIKRRKRFGLLLMTISVLFVALFIAPVTWALVYLFFDAPSTVLMMERAAEGQSIRHAPVPITRMSPYMVRSVIAAEDANFCTHHGFDVAAIQDAMESNADGGRMRGGSTISQQTAKNLFLWPQRSWVRKGFETYFTSLMEFMWPKRRIMEQYLNAVEFGDGIFGVEAAAQSRFGVSAADLTPLQAARLAAVLPSPNRWSATSPGPYVRERSASIVARAEVVARQHMAGCVLSLDAAP